jgi:NAD(P)-dependent dehydrogenase (short-subunit alcohol dehydrogenase family)
MTKLALVTGASAGIGRETCALFARKGCRVIALSRQPGGVEFADLEMTLDLESFDQIEGLAGTLDNEIESAERVIFVNNLYRIRANDWSNTGFN